MSDIFADISATLKTLTDIAERAHKHQLVTDRRLDELKAEVAGLRAREIGRGEDVESVTTTYPPEGE
ncbi:hypothetical protein KAR91_10470 [Candidatus Pacearchaeota archaeon]|nr:hypothetical protein [Candidatus Pacearchaeota archaeon]